MGALFDAYVFFGSISKDPEPAAPSVLRPPHSRARQATLLLVQHNLDVHKLATATNVILVQDMALYQVVSR